MISAGFLNIVDDRHGLKVILVTERKLTIREEEEDAIMTIPGEIELGGTILKPQSNMSASVKHRLTTLCNKETEVFTNCSKVATQMHRQ